ncbi:hypothetical protein O0L34_g4578 [Tuta absoluta]|nr:hypothetical protein O0L34_g4578 [Tuta absoluta]
MQISVSVFCILAIASVANGAPSTDIYEVASSRSARIVNGQAVDITSIPYQAALRRKVTGGWVFSCGAAILTNSAVITAAHCILTYVSAPSSLRVNVGSSYRNSGGKSYDIARVIVHEAYDQEFLVNDIGLLITSTRITFSESVQPISFATPTTKLPTGTPSLISGYGLTAKEGTPSPVLLAATVNIVDQATCSRAYVRITVISPGMVCANATSPPRDACQGDSGGPLVANGTLVGIVSWGEGCADRNYPGVYTRVSEYYSWILDKLNSYY